MKPIIIALVLMCTSTVFASQPPKPAAESNRMTLRRSGVSIRSNLKNLGLSVDNLPIQQKVEVNMLKILDKKMRMDRKHERDVKNFMMANIIRDMWQ